MNDLTDIDVRIISTVEAYQRFHHKSPTYSDISLGTGIPQSTVWRKVKKLVDRGFLSAEDGAHRSIVSPQGEKPIWIAKMSDGGQILVCCDTVERAKYIISCAMGQKTEEKRTKIVEISESSGKLADILAIPSASIEIIAHVEAKEDDYE